MTSITLSERARAIAALEQERQSLLEIAADTNLQQQLAFKSFKMVMREQSNRQMSIIEKLIGLESMIERLL